MTLFSDIEKDAGVWGGFAAKLIRRYGYPKAIQQRAIDMRSGLHEGVGVNLRIVRMMQDRFHVIQTEVDAFGQVRRTEIRGDAKRRVLLEGIRWMWRKNPVNRLAKEAQKWQAMALERSVGAWPAT